MAKKGKKPAKPSKQLELPVGAAAPAPKRGAPLPPPPLARSVTRVDLEEEMKSSYID